MMENNTKEMDILLAEKEVVVNSEVIIIRPYSWSQSIKVIKPLGALLNVLVENIDDVDSALQEYKSSQNKISLVQAFSKLIGKIDTEAIVSNFNVLIATAIKKPNEYMDELMIDDAFALMEAIYEVNKNFFMHCLAKIQTPSKKIK